MELEGEEELLFAPGMFKQGASDFFSYAFVLRYPKQADIPTSRVVTLLEQYYRGLMSAVAADKDFDMEAVKSVQVSVTSERESALAIEVQTFDAFVTGAPITLEMQIERQSVEGGTCLVAQVAPGSAAKEIWPKLAGAAKRLSCVRD
jgi:hypothetical protein